MTYQEFINYKTQVRNLSRTRIARYIDTLITQTKTLETLDADEEAIKNETIYQLYAIKDLVTNYHPD